MRPTLILCPEMGSHEDKKQSLLPIIKPVPSFQMVFFHSHLAKATKEVKFICLLVEEDVVLRAEADGLTDLVDGGPDVEAVDLGRAGRRRKHPGQDGAEI